MGESIRPLSFCNPTLSVNKHVAQICRFSLSAPADLADGSRERQTSPFNGDAQSWNGIERSLSRGCIPTVSARLCSPGSNSIVFVHRTVALVKEYPLPKLFYKAELLPFEKEKYINLVCSSCLKHANEGGSGVMRSAANRHVKMVKVSRRVPDTSVRGSRSYHAQCPNQPVYIDVAQEKSQVFWK